MFNLDLGLFNLREFPLVTEVFSSKRLFEGMPSNPLSILNVLTCLLNHISFICEDTHKVWYKKSFKLTLLLKVNDI